MSSTFVAFGLADQCRSEQLIELLQENEKFPRFLDLPPEIRGIVYEHYFDFNPHEFTSIGVAPPVTEVSKLLRAEALPQWWADRRLPINIIDGSRRKLQYTYFDADCHRFLLRAPKKIIEMVRSLYVRFGHEGCDKSEWEIDLAKGDKGPAVRRVKGDEDIFDEPLLEFLHAIANRAGSKTFSRLDVMKLESLLKKTLAKKARLGEE